MLGRPQLHLFAETKSDAGKWIPDTAQTFKEQESPVTGRLVREMDETPCPNDLPLYGLLCDEVWESLPWSCWQKGLPEDASPQVLALSQEWEEEAFGHNYLTMEELAEKYAELVKDPRPQARKLQQPLAEMLYTLSANSTEQVSPADRRVVFWFH